MPDGAIEEIVADVHNTRLSIASASTTSLLTDGGTHSPVSLREFLQDERTVFAVRALDREVNNGGYDQFFRNSSNKFAPEIVQSLTRIGCRRTAQITQRAINALHSGPLTVARIKAAMRETNEERDRELERMPQVRRVTPNCYPRVAVEVVSARVRQAVDELAFWGSRQHRGDSGAEAKLPVRQHGRELEEMREEARLVRAHDGDNDEVFLVT